LPVVPLYLRILDGLGGLGLIRPAVVFAALAVAAGVLLTFLPIAVPALSRGVAAVALLAHACATPLARWAAGRYGDRRGRPRLARTAGIDDRLGADLMEGDAAELRGVHRDRLPEQPRLLAIE
jgi:hypothetical protein